MQGKPWGEERYREREGEIERKKGRKKKGGSRMHVRGWVATASDGFELGKVQRLKRDTPHPLHPFESTPPWFTLPPSSPASFLASPRLLSPVGQLHSCTNPRAPTIPPQTNRASRAHVYTYTCTICECTCAHRHIHKRVPLPICTLLCHLPSTSAQHAARFPLCVRVTTIPTTWTTARSSFLVALHRANDTTGKGITLLVPFGIAFQKERCLMRYPNISPRRHSLSLSLCFFLFLFPRSFFFARLFFSTRALFVLPATFAFDLYTLSGLIARLPRNTRLPSNYPRGSKAYQLQDRTTVSLTTLCLVYWNTRCDSTKLPRIGKQTSLSRIKAEASLLVGAKNLISFHWRRSSQRIGISENSPYGFS